MSKNGFDQYVKDTERYIVYLERENKEAYDMIRNILSQHNMTKTLTYWTIIFISGFIAGAIYY